MGRLIVGGGDGSRRRWCRADRVLLFVRARRIGRRARRRRRSVLCRRRWRQRLRWWRVRDPRRDKVGQPTRLRICIDDLQKDRQHTTERHVTTNRSVTITDARTS